MDIIVSSRYGKEKSVETLDARRLFFGDAECVALACVCVCKRERGMSSRDAARRRRRSLLLCAREISRVLLVMKES